MEQSCSGLLRAPPSARKPNVSIDSSALSFGFNSSRNGRISFKRQCLSYSPQPITRPGSHFKRNASFHWSSKCNSCSTRTLLLMPKSTTSSIILLLRSMVGTDRKTYHPCWEYMAHYSKPQDKPSISLANSHEDGYPAIRDGPSQAGFAHLLVSSRGCVGIARNDSAASSVRWQAALRGVAAEESR